MGAYSTIHISREAAQNAIRELIECMDNGELGDVLFSMTQNHALDNYQVGYDDSGDSFLESTVQRMKYNSEDPERETDEDEEAD